MLKGKDAESKYPSIDSSIYKDKVLFVHIPKAAGSTVSLLLYGYRIGHKYISDYHRMDPKFTQEAFKFSFVRHPYFRFKSAYNFLKSGGMSSRDSDYLKKYDKEFESLETLAEAVEDANIRQNIVHLRPQYEYLSVPRTSLYKIHMDYIGKTEFMRESIDVIKEYIPNHLLSRFNKVVDTKYNNSKKNTKYINKEAFNKIRKVYQDDYELFGYDEWGTVEKAYDLIDYKK